MDDDFDDDEDDGYNKIGVSSSGFASGANFNNVDENHVGEFGNQVQFEGNVQPARNSFVSSNKTPDRTGDKRSRLSSAKQ